MDSKQNNQPGYRHDLSVSDIKGNPTNEKSFYFDPVSFRDTFPIPRYFADPPYDTIDLIKVPKDKIKKEFIIKIDSLSLERFSKILSDNKEPVLSNYYLGKDIYRLTWHRTFHQTIVIKIINDKDECFIETKRLNWIDKKYSVSTKRTTVAKVSELHDMLETFNFYETKSYDWENLGFDGSKWILEVHLADRYHFISKWSPDFGHSNGLREIGEYIIRNSDAKEEEIY
jgi:hypothetical protein